jgi:uncharacterized membrane protein YbhN (UPF0104 family)
MTGGTRPKFSVRPLESGGPVLMPEDFKPRSLARRAAPVLSLLVVIGLVILLAPGLGDVRHQLTDARPGWLALGVALEALSCVSYVLMFRPIFCLRMRWRSTWEIAWSELAMGSLVPASGAGGLALGAWILRQGGMPADQIAHRSVAFFLIKSSVNFVAVAVVGAAMALGLGPHQSLWLTALPAGLSVAFIAFVLWLPRLGPGAAPGPDAGRVPRAVSSARAALIEGTAGAVEVVRARDWQAIAGAIGYWAFDNAVLWATFHAVGYAPPLTVVLMGYLIGQLGGLLPIPGGIGGIDGGLIGTLVVYGTPAATTAAAVLAYRVILFWLPLLVGGVAFASLRKGLNQPDRPDLCVVPSVDAA